LTFPTAIHSNAVLATHPSPNPQLHSQFRLMAPWTVLKLAILATLVSAQTHPTLGSQLVSAAGYQGLPNCQQYCIAGRADGRDPATDLVSVVAVSTCETKECFCSEGNRNNIYQAMEKCVVNSGSDCRDYVGNFNGGVSFIGKFCGFEPNFKV